jgi:hypothetical protein
MAYVPQPDVPDRVRLVMSTFGRKNKGKTRTPKQKERYRLARLRVLAEKRKTQAA